MRKYLSLALGILAIFNVVYTFIQDREVPYTFFGFETNVWVYRFIWIILAALMLYNFRKQQTT